MGLWERFVNWLAGDTRRVVVQSNNVVGGDLAGGINLDGIKVGRSLKTKGRVRGRNIQVGDIRIDGDNIDCGDIHIRGDNISIGVDMHVRKGCVTTQHIVCTGDLCINGNDIKIDGVSFRLKEHPEGMPSLFINGVPYGPWSKEPIPPPDQAYPPWTGEINGHKIKVAAKSLTVDGIEYRR